MVIAPSNERMIAGVAAATVSLGVAQLVGIPFGARADARAAIGSVAVDLTPGPIKEWAIQTLGSLDKLFLAVVVLVVIATIAAIAGTLETHRRPLDSAMVGGAGVLGYIAVLSRQGATAFDTTGRARAGHRVGPSRPSRGSTCRKVIRKCRWGPSFLAVSRGHRIAAYGP